MQRTNSDGGLRIERYWDFPRVAARRSVSLRDAEAEIEHELERSVRARLVADVPVARARRWCPGLGMLSWDVEAFLAGSRRDLFFVPIAINYERLVEEGAMVDELEGGEKVNESTLGLLRARKYLRRRFGSVFLNFGEPISLAEAMGSDRALFAASASPEVEIAKRRFVEGLGNRVVERINWATVANATSVAASALLGTPARGLVPT